MCLLIFFISMLDSSILPWISLTALISTFYIPATFQYAMKTVTHNLYMYYIFSNHCCMFNESVVIFNVLKDFSNIYNKDILCRDVCILFYWMRKNYFCLIFWLTKIIKKKWNWLNYLNLQIMSNQSVNI